MLCIAIAIPTTINKGKNQLQSIPNPLPPVNNPKKAKTATRDKALIKD